MPRVSREIAEQVRAELDALRVVARNDPAQFQALTGLSSFTGLPLSENPSLEGAVRFLGARHELIELVPFSKFPVAGKKWSLRKHRITTYPQVVEILSREPNANFGLVTGQRASRKDPRRVIVLDADDQELFQRLIGQGALPHTVTFRGGHLPFVYSGRSKLSSRSGTGTLEGGDLKGFHGVVVIAPGRVFRDDGTPFAYTDAPAGWSVYGYSLDALPVAPAEIVQQMQPTKRSAKKVKPDQTPWAELKLKRRGVALAPREDHPEWLTYSANPYGFPGVYSRSLQAQGRGEQREAVWEEVKASEVGAAITEREFDRKWDEAVEAHSSSPGWKATGRGPVAITALDHERIDHWVARVREDQHLSDAERAVVLAHGEYCRIYGLNCYAPVRQIAELAGVDKGTVSRVRRRQKVAKWLKVWMRPQSQQTEHGQAYYVSLVAEGVVLFAEEGQHPVLSDPHLVEGPPLIDFDQDVDLRGSALVAASTRQPSLLHKINKPSIAQAAQALEEAAKALRDSQEATLNDLTDLLVGLVEERHGASPPRPQDDRAVVQSLIARIGPDQAREVINYAFTDLDGHWKGSPIRTKRFLPASDAYFLQPVLAHLAQRAQEPSEVRHTLLAVPFQVGAPEALHQPECLPAVVGLDL